MTVKVVAAPFLARPFSFLLLLIGIAVSSCSTVTWVPGLNSNPPPLDKRVMVSPLIDLAGLGEEQCRRLDGMLVNLLMKSPGMTLYRAPQDLNLPSQIKSPQFGIIPQQELVGRAAELGMNALVTGAVYPVEVTTGKEGIWPFRKVMRTYSLSMVINVVDVNSGCLYLTRIESKKISLPLSEVEGLEEKQVLTDTLEKGIPSLLDRQVSAIGKRLQEEPWSGKVVLSKDGSLMINAGDDVGVRTGQVFTVYAQGESILCQSGEKKEILGKKIGEIQATAVMKDRCTAVLVKGGPVEDGQVVRLIR